MWTRYAENLASVAEKNGWQMPFLPSYCQTNGHIFYMVMKSKLERDTFLHYLKEQGIDARFHYQALHQSIYIKDTYKGTPLNHAIKYSDGLVRLPNSFPHCRYLLAV